MLRFVGGIHVRLRGLVGRWIVGWLMSVLLEVIGLGDCRCVRVEVGESVGSSNRVIIISVGFNIGVKVRTIVRISFTFSNLFSQNL